jgi:hypothetical protein
MYSFTRLHSCIMIFIWVHLNYIDTFIIAIKHILVLKRALVITMAIKNL